MDKLWLYRVLSRLPLLSYRSKIVTCAIVAATFPLVALISLRQAPQAVWTPVMAGSLACALITLIALAHLLRPIELTAQALRDFAADRSTGSLPSDLTGEAGVMMADVSHLGDRLA